MGFPTRYDFEDGVKYDESQDAFLVDYKPFPPLEDAEIQDDLVIRREHDWSHYTEIENQDLYNLLYMLRDSDADDAMYRLARDLYSDLRRYRNENDIF